MPLLKKFALLMKTRVIKFGDSYEAPQDVAATGSASEGSAKKKGRTVAVTTKDMQKRRNDVKARTTLLLALPDEHQLRFSKYKTAQELWAAILNTFEGKETLEQTFNRLQGILMHTIVWRNRSDLDMMSLDDLYNHLKVYEPEVQKKLDSHNMAFISSAKNSSGNEEVNTTSIFTANIQVSPASANVAAANTGRRLGKRSPYKVLMWLALISQRLSALTTTRWATLLGSVGLPGAKTGVEEKTTDKVQKRKNRLPRL
nr:hypothetical protein [Tanacetum cinerariifolium]